MTSNTELLAAEKFAATDAKQTPITSTVVNFVAETLSPLSFIEASL